MAEKKILDQTIPPREYTSLVLHQGETLRKKLYRSRVHVWMENLAGSMEDSLLTGIFCIVNPKGNSGKTKMSHRGEEMILVLDNVIEFNIRNKIHRLLKGDCLHFRSELPHSWRNPSGRKTKALWVFAPAPFLL